MKHTPGPFTGDPIDDYTGEPLEPDITQQQARDLLAAAEVVIIALGNIEDESGMQQNICPICGRTDGMHILPEEHSEGLPCARLAAAINAIKGT